MLCGTARSLKSIQEEELWPSSSPKESNKKANKNPFSTRGLDKYSTVLEELEARKTEIKEKLKSSQQSVSVVRFMYSSSKDWIPVIIQLQDIKHYNFSSHQNLSHAKKPKRPPSLPMQAEHVSVKRETSAVDTVAAAKEKMKVKRSSSWNVRGLYWRKWKPGFHWSMTMVLIMLCLLMFGRVFAICCTTIFWYLVPLMQEENKRGKDKRTLKTKDVNYARRASNSISKMGGSFVARSCS